MDLDGNQTRRLFLAGTVAFPVPFPKVGTISIERGHIFHGVEGSEEDAEFVVVEEKSGIERSKIRVIRREDVAAIFLPRFWKRRRNRSPAFRCGDGHAVDFDQGQWFLKPGADIATKIKNFLNSYAEEHEKKLGKDQAEKSKKRRADIGRRDSGVKGIVFVPRDRPVVTIDECTRPAGRVGGYRIKSGCC